MATKQDPLTVVAALESPDCVRRSVSVPWHETRNLARKFGTSVPKYLKGKIRNVNCLIRNMQDPIRADVVRTSLLDSPKTRGLVQPVFRSSVRELRKLDESELAPKERLLATRSEPSAVYLTRFQP